MIPNPGTDRLLPALIAVMLYLWIIGVTIHRVWRQRQRARADATALTRASAGANTWLVVYSSQTGNAEYFAWETARALHTAGLAAQICNIALLEPNVLRKSERMFLVVSTYGEGDPPDSGNVFARRVMAGAIDLSHLHYGVLALGDSEYRQFCGFGRTVDAWLKSCGASSLFDRVEVSNSDAQALSTWRHHLSHIAGTDDLPDWNAPAFDEWKLISRRQMNPGSAGAPIFQLEFVPTSGPLPGWESGDLAQIILPDDKDHPRDYSIANIPADNCLQLLVRRELRSDGSVGAASGWLSTELAPGATMSMRLRGHDNFRLGLNSARPLILIGNGTGIAGLRAHLKARVANATSRNWLIFGERNSRFDDLYGDELEAWHRSGILTRLDRVYSRDQEERRYVQHQLRGSAAEVRAWIADGAAIYVCGSLIGMAGEVETALNDILGTTEVEQLAASGRYRRDVY